ncbi:MAG: T9SS type A sorting domain-containing protein, partial [Bacteroidota bacterium]|nr:T9SS type A sorting domain-containing protein [Bacteroidota bacterium]
ISFDGVLQGTSIDLTWVTSSEQGSSYFGLEKSADGTHFQILATVQAAGISANSTRYHYLDPQVSAENFYRLKMVNRDGKFVYSNTILIENPGAPQEVWIGNNPVGNVLLIRLAKSPSHKVGIELFSETGQRVFAGDYGVQNEFSIDLSPYHLSHGIYILKTLVDDRIFVNKLIKQ